jgi:hypothetical protein
MNNKFGVRLGLIALGMTLVGSPAGKAQSRVEQNASGGIRASLGTPSDPAPAVSSAADLDRRVEELERELVDLRAELVARKEAEATPAPVPAPAFPAQDKPADKVTVASLFGPTSVSGFVDVNYQANLNHPVSNTTALRSFEFRDKSINLNMIELILDKAPDASGPAGRIGYHVSLGFGDSMTAIDATERASSGGGNNAPGFDQYVKEAYGSYLAPLGKGLQIDIGKFVTPMGAEVIESKDNWNYSRGILFSYAIPYFHFGGRAKYAFNDKYNVTGFVTNGWNNVVDNNSGKTYGFSFAGTPTKQVGFVINYLAGPETTNFANGGPFAATVNVNNFWRQTWDAVATYNPNAKLSLMANFDYGRGDRTSPVLTVKPVYWTGGAAYAKYAWDDKDYVAGRYEYFLDHDGFTTGSPIHTHFQEFTGTYQRTIESYLLARFEYRRDMSSSPYFPMSTNPALFKYQNTVTLGLVFLFDSRNAK